MADPSRIVRLVTTASLLALASPAAQAGVFECPPGSGQFQGEPCGGPAQTATVYSCDNDRVSPSGSAPCFRPSDPRHMTVSLKSRPGGGESIGRKTDPGEGLAAKVKDSREFLGTRWYLVAVEGLGEGWIGEHLLKLEGEADLPAVNR